MKKLSLALLILIGLGFASIAQIDRDQLSLDISKADAANTGQLMAFIWKMNSIVMVDGAQKATALNEFSIEDDGKVSVTNLSSDTDVKQKRGIRGKVQASTAQGNLDYVQHALDIYTQYAFMSKGQLLDFFDRAVITEKDGVIEATSSDVLVKGDKLTVKVESATKLFMHKEFSSLMGEDPISGVIDYGKFKSGISHASTSVLNLPAKKAVINSTNKDYVQKVQ